MRIVAGARRGLVLRGPDDLSTRPTSDRARQVIFDILAHAGWATRHHVQNAMILDGFAGTGALGLEALSRGAAHVTFMDNNTSAYRVMAGNIRRARFEHISAPLKCDVTAPPLASNQVGIAFLDPPYRQDLLSPAISALIRTGWIGANSLIVTEAEGELDLPDIGLPLDARKIGMAHVSFWIGAQWMR